jgi:hypothetical protein
MARSNYEYDDDEDDGRSLESGCNPQRAQSGQPGSYCRQERQSIINVEQVPIGTLVLHKKSLSFIRYSEVIDSSSNAASCDTSLTYVLAAIVL